MQAVHDFDGDVVDVPVYLSESQLDLGLVAAEGVHESASLFQQFALELLILGLECCDL